MLHINTVLCEYGRRLHNTLEYIYIYIYIYIYPYIISYLVQKHLCFDAFLLPLKHDICTDSLTWAANSVTLWKPECFSDQTDAVLAYNIVRISTHWVCKQHSAFAYARLIKKNRSCYGVWSPTMGLSVPWFGFSWLFNMFEKSYAFRVDTNDVTHTRIRPHMEGSIFRDTASHRWMSLTKPGDAGLWCFLLISAWTNNCVNNRDAGDLRLHAFAITVYCVARAQ